QKVDRIINKYFRSVLPSVRLLIPFEWNAGIAFVDTCISVGACQPFERLRTTGEQPTSEFFDLDLMNLMRRDRCRD
ncbi:MAG: hypothetical protein VXW49_13355, partial [Pseudomonadota bacterium]|nr:hypothetical protein [Pseudomonadota bacterium]